MTARRVSLEQKLSALDADLTRGAYLTRIADERRATDARNDAYLAECIARLQATRDAIARKIAIHEGAPFAPTTN